MSIPLVYTWSLGEELTSAQLNALATYLTYAIDKRAGQTDSLSSVVSCSGAGRIVPAFSVGADADTTYAVATGITVIDASSGLTANRIYTLSTTGAVTGDTVTVLGHATYDVTVKVGGTTLLVVGGGTTGNNQSRWGDFRFNGSTWVLFRSSYALPHARQVFTSAGTYTVPADCYKVLVMAVGGGGGGGGGSAGSSTTTAAIGGGGGGAAMFGAYLVDTTPGTAFGVTPGVGGVGGAGGNNSGGQNLGTDGGDGTDTLFGTALTFRGAQGGSGGWQSSNNTIEGFASGGGVIQGAPKPGRYLRFQVGGLSVGFDFCPFCPRLPGEGGYGNGKGSSGAAVGTGAGSSGNYSHVVAVAGGSTTPGTGGAQGATGGGVLGGGGAGGGGASLFGNGGAGGAGSPGVSGSPAANGNAGLAGGVGAGGGGGGASGGGSSISSGGAGAAGGSGALIAVPIR